MAAAGRPWYGADVKPTVYTETTIPSCLAAAPSRDLVVAACQPATRDWWDGSRHLCRLYTSQLVLAEIGFGDSAVAGRRLSLLDGIDVLPVTAAMRDLAKTLVRDGALPHKAEADALHIAVAAVSGLDFLLTWNCRHIDNPATKPVIRSVCGAGGWRCPEICTPMELLESRANG